MWNLIRGTGKVCAVENADFNCVRVTVELLWITRRAQAYFRVASWIWRVSRYSVCIKSLKKETSFISKRKSFFSYIIIPSESTLNISHQAVIWMRPISGHSSSVRGILWLLLVCGFTCPLEDTVCFSFQYLLFINRKSIFLFDVSSYWQPCMCSLHLNSRLSSSGAALGISNSQVQPDRSVPVPVW